MNIKLKLEEKRRQIENDKRKMESLMNRQRTQIGKAAFLQAVTKVIFIHYQNKYDNTSFIFIFRVKIVKMYKAQIQIIIILCLVMTIQHHLPKLLNRVFHFKYNSVFLLLLLLFSIFST